jgi:hypothetical protein
MVGDADGHRCLAICATFHLAALVWPAASAFKPDYFQQNAQRLDMAQPESTSYPDRTLKYQEK